MRRHAVQYCTVLYQKAYMIWRLLWPIWVPTIGPDDTAKYENRVLSLSIGQTTWFCDATGDCVRGFTDYRILITASVVAVLMAGIKT